MALTQEDFDSIICKAKRCYSALAQRTAKNRNYGETDKVDFNTPIMKKYYSLLFVLQNEYNTSFCDCTPCSCNGEPYSEPDDLSCKTRCLTDDEICLLSEKINILCSVTAKACA